MSSFDRLFVCRTPLAQVTPSIRGSKASNTLLSSGPGLSPFGGATIDPKKLNLASAKRLDMTRSDLLNTIAFKYETYCDLNDVITGIDKQISEIDGSRMLSQEAQQALEKKRLDRAKMLASLRPASAAAKTPLWDKGLATFSSFTSGCVGGSSFASASASAGVGTLLNTFSSSNLLVVEGGVELVEATAAAAAAASSSSNPNILQLEGASTS